MNEPIVIAIIGLLVTVTHLMFPALFLSMGNFLKNLKWYVWVISILIIVTVGQTYFLFKGGVI